MANKKSITSKKIIGIIIALILILSAVIVSSKEYPITSTPMPEIKAGDIIVETADAEYPIVYRYSFYSGKYEPQNSPNLAKIKDKEQLRTYYSQPDRNYHEIRRATSSEDWNTYIAWRSKTEPANLDQTQYQTWRDTQPLTSNEINRMNELYKEQKTRDLTLDEENELESISLSYALEIAQGKRDPEKVEEPEEEKEPAPEEEGTFTKENMQRMNELSEKQEKEKLTPEEEKELESLSLDYAGSVVRESRTPLTLRQTVSAISQFLTVYDQYRGFSRFSSLFFTSDAWERHREKVNQAFCDTILLGGTQCWTSRICDTQLYPLLSRGTFSGRTPSGERQATATIQGEKSLPIQGVDDFGNPIMQRLYKITYAINNPYSAQELKYNIQFRTEDGYKLNWFSDYQTTPASRTEASPLMDYGKNDYSAVCLIFHPSLIDYRSNWHGRRIREWCTPIIQYIGTATKPYPTASNTTEESITPSAPVGLPQTTGRPGF